MDHAKQRSFHTTDPNTHRRASLSAHQHTAFRTLDHRQPTLEYACSRRHSDLMTRDEPDLVVGDHDHQANQSSYIMERRNSSRPTQWEYSRPWDGHAQSHHHSFSDLGRHYEDAMNGDARRRPSLAMSDLESSNDDFQQPPVKGIRRDYSSSWGRASSFSSVPSIMSSDVSGYNGIDNRTKRGTGRLKVCLSDDEESLSSEAFQADAPPRTRPFSRDVPSIEIAPGQFAELRGSAETHHAIQRDFVRPCTCLCCRVELHCIRDASYVVCPDCLVVNSLDGSLPLGRHGGVGLGFKTKELGAKHPEHVLLRKPSDW
jgi:hypothetical protein